MDHSQFVQSVVDAGLVFSSGMDSFTDEVIRRWLQDNTWVEDPTSRCKWCQHMEEIKSGFSEEQCRLNVSGGGSCYRETLKQAFIPFLKNALLGIYPSLDDFHKVIHHKGTIWDGCDNMTLVDIVCHELGGTYMQMDIEAARQNATH